MIRPILLLACAPSVLLFGQQALRITSPANGAIVHSGESLKVTVEASGFVKVFVTGWNIGVIGISSEPPHQFAIRLDPDMASDTYPLTAFGVTTNGITAQSEPVLVHVERPDNPIRLKVNLDTLSFDLAEVGQTGLSLAVSGRFADGHEVDLTHSVRTTYTSDKPAVAEISHDARVTPAGLGSARITIRHAGLTIVVPVRVGNATPPPAR